MIVIRETLSTLKENDVIKINDRKLVVFRNNCECNTAMINGELEATKKWQEIALFDDNGFEYLLVVDPRESVPLEFYHLTRKYMSPPCEEEHTKILIKSFSFSKQKL